MSIARAITAATIVSACTAPLPAQGTPRMVIAGTQQQLRAGRYLEAIDAMRALARADETRERPYHYQLLAFSATMAGRSATAITAARDGARRVSIDAATRDPELQIVAAYPQLTLATFGRWTEVLRAPLPSPRLRVATALAWHARGVAQARAGRLADASAAMDTIRVIALQERRWPVNTVVRIASLALESELLAAHGEWRSAAQRLAEARELEDSLGDIGFPYWPQPLRQLLGAALLSAGRAGDAATRYREDLARYPDNIWSLAGLARAYEAMGRGAEARMLRQRLARVAERADVTVWGSRF